MIGIVSQNRFHMICHTSNCCTMGGTDKYFRVFSFTWNAIPVNMLDYAVSNYIYLFCTYGFRTFLLFISFLTLPFITDAFTLRVSLEVLLCSVIDRLKSVSFGSNDVLFFFNSGDFSLLAILSSWIVLLMLFLWGVLQDRFSKSCVCRLTLSL